MRRRGGTNLYLIPLWYNILPMTPSFTFNLPSYLSLSLYIYIYIFMLPKEENWHSDSSSNPRRDSANHHHHHHVVPLSQISQTLSRHFSQSFIVSGRSSGLHPVSSHSCCMYVLAGRPAFAWPYAGVHRSISPMSSSLILQRCPACLVRLAWIVFVMGGRWPYSWCQKLFNIYRRFLV